MVESATKSKLQFASLAQSCDRLDLITVGGPGDLQIISISHPCYITVISQLQTVTVNLPYFQHEIIYVHQQSNLGLNLVGEARFQSRRPDIQIWPRLLSYWPLQFWPGAAVHVTGHHVPMTSLTYQVWKIDWHLAGLNFDNGQRTSWCLQNINNSEVLQNSASLCLVIGTMSMSPRGGRPYKWPQLGWSQDVAAFAQLGWSSRPPFTVNGLACRCPIEVDWLLSYKPYVNSCTVCWLNVNSSSS